MPNYDYHCTKCGHKEEIFQKMSDAPLTTCSKCGKAGFVRKPGGGIGLQFKGTGFYITDYPSGKQETNGACCPCGKGSCE